MSLRLCGADIEELLTPAKISISFDSCALKARNLYEGIKDAVETKNYSRLGYNPCKYFNPENNSWLDDGIDLFEVKLLPESVMITVKNKKLKDFE